MICWINPFSGLAGDMLLAALLDAGDGDGDGDGDELTYVRDAIGATGLTGWELDRVRVTAHGLTASQVRVTVLDPAAERNAADLIALAARARPQPVADLAVRALTAIAETEARLHGTSPAAVRLHELGGHDALIDIVGTAAALHALGVTEVLCAPLPLGVGRVRAAHGLLPAPAPATLDLLRGAAITGTDLPGETVTPTAAALLHAMGASYGPPPRMTLGRTGYGAGTRQLADRPNVASVTLGVPASVTLGVPASATGPAPTGPAPGGPAISTIEPVDVLETNLDDVTGELLGHVIGQALRAGALDAWVTPTMTKKSRPAHVLHVLARPRDADELLRLVFSETGTLGIRRTPIMRAVLCRSETTIDVDGLPVRVKHGPHGAKAEHDDLAAAAASLGLPLRAVARRVARAVDAAPGPAPELEPDAPTSDGGSRERDDSGRDNQGALR